MNPGRTVLQTQMPKSRLDAGTFGTMGVGLGQVRNETRLFLSHVHIKPLSLPRQARDEHKETLKKRGVFLQAIAACVVHPERPVVLVIGDSAFGFR